MDDRPRSGRDDVRRDALRAPTRCGAVGELHLDIEMGALDARRRTALAIDVDAFRAKACDRDLLLASDGALSVVYAPFEHVNERARLVLVGLTPGRTQAANALAEFQRASAAGAGTAAALAAAKVHASFSGPMRGNLIAMLDSVGVARLLGLASCGELFGARSDLAHFTSALRYPVFVDGENYGGTPPILRRSSLLGMARRWLAEELGSLPDAFVVPLGPKVAGVLSWLAANGALDEHRILDGMPHPSGANAERIGYFLGKIGRDALSTRTEPGRIDKARGALVAKIALLLGEP